ncbi:hypothetical protein FACS1894195_5700 [Bacteroidia bacterium]|nr:hypothetical protein FACS1894195_5700 [Bacteroidia bacterium]
MLDLADAGEQIVIKRRYKPSYRLAPIEDVAVKEVEDDDDPDQTDEEVEAYFTPAMRAKIDRAMEEYRAGKVTICRTHEESANHLASLWHTH